MRRIILFVCIIGCCLSAQNSFAQSTPADGYEIKIQLKPFHNEKIYFGHYFAGHIYLVDSVLLNDRSEGSFKGPVKLPEGIYAIFYPDRSFMCDVMMDTLQYFSINAEKPASGNLILQFKNSPDNSLLDQYEHYMAVQGAAMRTSQQSLKKATNAIDSTIWLHKLTMIDDSVDHFREAIIKKIPGSSLSRLFIAMRGVKIPPSLAAPKNAADSVAARQFVSDHYWDGVNFWDGSLTYSPFFEDKLDNYFNHALPPSDDTAIKKIDWMMSYAGASETMTEFLLHRFLNGSIYHNYKWGDLVLIHLFEKYVGQKTYAWLSAAERKIITDKAYFAMGSMTGMPAPDISLPAIDGKNISMYALDAKYTLLCFWDPVCSHCRATLPQMDSVYLEKWKAVGVKIFSVAGETDGTKNDWINFINQHKLQEWTNVYYSAADDKKRSESGQKGYIQLYDVQYYPAFFLLDKDKKFIAKKLKFEQMVELLESIRKKNDPARR